MISSALGAFATARSHARLLLRAVGTDQNHPMDEEADHPDAVDAHDHAPEAVDAVVAMMVVVAHSMTSQLTRSTVPQASQSGPSKSAI